MFGCPCKQHISRQLKDKDGEVHWDKISGMVAFEKNWLKKLGKKFGADCIPNLINNFE